MPSLPAVIAFKRATLLSNYANVAGATLFIYDSLIMFPSEIEQRIYWFTGRQQSIVTNIYSIMKLVGALYFIEEVNREKQRTDKSLWPAILQIRDLTPILYIFYRDGALASIPILVVDTLEVIARAFPSSAVGGINWNIALTPV
ncbi:hypothetical protein D9756_006712 [Leucocoprinus leucothites]|uniref:Uncharacterized protein n=1 Tax=Leucocoprinus leucothites TaxID=201217 RepID=A0A8H5G2F7_9AGAR|nr:hypothetical protein D9756_006712 [Leucoagaricus leucothites]